jgi:hypothetical protein
LSILTKFFGRTASEGAAFALGTAVGPVLRPAVQELTNAAWLAHPARPIDPVLAAQAVAQGQIERVWAETEVRYSGIDGERFDRLVAAFDTGPGVATAFQLWRRGIIDEAGFRRAVKREGIEPEWINDLVEIRNVLLSPAELAMMRQQGFIDRARQVEESARQGITEERADLLFEVSGLPPGIETALSMLRRSIITEGEFAQIVREGHTKTKYTDELLALRHPVLSATQAATLRLKGWISAETSYELGALTGYTSEQMDRIFLAMGRPAAPVQMFNGWARGIDGPDGRPMDKAQFMKGIRESDIRPEWGEMLWGIRHSYPSLFQLRRAVQDGGISRARALTILHYERYEDQDATALVDSWMTGTGTTAKGLTVTDLANEYEARWLTRTEYIAQLRQLGYSADNAAAKADAEDARRARLARNRRVELIGQRYQHHSLSRDQTVASLNAAEVPARVRDSLLLEWDAMREITPDALTSAQIKKAFAKAQITRVEAVARLLAKGYEEPDANIYLDQ